jgi:hypothetical protein
MTRSVTLPPPVRRRRGSTTLGLAAVAVWTLVGCGGPAASEPAVSGPAAGSLTASASRSPAPSMEDGRVPAPGAASTEGDHAAVAAAYQRFWSTVYDLDDQPLDQWAGMLAAVTTTPLFPRLLAGMQAQHESGIREYGTVRTHPVTIQVHGDTATLLDCQDASGAGEAHIDTGLPTTVGQSRTPFAAALRRGTDRRWRVADAQQLDDTC